MKLQFHCIALSLHYSLCCGLILAIYQGAFTLADAPAPQFRCKNPSGEFPHELLGLDTDWHVISCSLPFLSMGHSLTDSLGTPHPWGSSIQSPSRCICTCKCTLTTPARLLPCSSSFVILSEVQYLESCFLAPKNNSESCVYLGLCKAPCTWDVQLLCIQSWHFWALRKHRCRIQPCSQSVYAG